MSNTLAAQIASTLAAVCTLEDDILYLEQQMKGMTEDSPAYESKDRILNVKWRLLSEQRERLAALDSRASKH